MRGKFRNEDKPTFTGQIADDCKGMMDFPDDRLKSFEYDEETYEIFWDDRNTGDIWKKGN